MNKTWKIILLVSFALGALIFIFHKQIIKWLDKGSPIREVPPTGTANTTTTPTNNASPVIQQGPALNYKLLLYKGRAFPNEIRELQKELKIPVDGVFGSQTEAAVLKATGATSATLLDIYRVTNPAKYNGISQEGLSTWTQKFKTIFS